MSGRHIVFIDKAGKEHARIPLTERPPAWIERDGRWWGFATARLNGDWYFYEATRRNGQPRKRVIMKQYIVITADTMGPLLLKFHGPFDDTKPAHDYRDAFQSCGELATVQELINVSVPKGVDDPLLKQAQAHMPEVDSHWEHPVLRVNVGKDIKLHFGNCDGDYAVDVFKGERIVALSSTIPESSSMGHVIAWVREVVADVKRLLQ